MHIAILEIIVLRFNMQGADVNEHTNHKCHVFTFLNLCKRKVFLSIRMPSVICVHFSQFVDHCVT